MTNIIVPTAGNHLYFSDEAYPKPLFEIKGVPMIEYVISYLSKIAGPKRFIFIVNQQECINFHLDKTLKLLCPDECIIIEQSRLTKGAACSCLLAIDQIQRDEPLIISNADQFLNIDLNSVLDFFKTNRADGGVITFESVHPKWSYVKATQGVVNETAEKKPISRNAIAGFYYFSKGQYFVDASFLSLKRGETANGLFYIAPIFNELILQGKKILHRQIDNENYHSFYSLEKIEEFKIKMNQGLNLDLKIYPGSKS